MICMRWLGRRGLSGLIRLSLLFWRLMVVFFFLFVRSRIADGYY